MHSAALTIPSPAVETASEFHSVRMNWVIVTDKSGNRRPQMHWRADCPR